MSHTSAAQPTTYWTSLGLTSQSQPDQLRQSSMDEAVKSGNRHTKVCPHSSGNRLGVSSDSLYAWLRDSVNLVGWVFEKPRKTSNFLEEYQPVILAVRGSRIDPALASLQKRPYLRQLMECRNNLPLQSEISRTVCQSRGTV